ncbi:MAG: DUF1549 domain-containing protein, partial [Planctomycetes bacterium]|nr:DUF1549 domain-containing protein [Planctomycetota bacterium]
MCVCVWEISVASPLEYSLKNPRDRHLENPEDFFEKRIRPILSEECYRCHSSRSKKLRGGLRVDGREALIEGGDSGPALVPGKPKESLLLRAISYLDNELEMPPSGKLDPQVIADFEHWITIGAPWPGTKATKATKKRPTAGYDWSRFRSEHWSYREVTRPQPPQVRRDAWIRTPVDRFVLAQLESNGLSTAPEANPRILIRRVYFDVIGLPPSPDEVAQFVEDAANEESSGIAFAKVVDRLLSAPQYGERWARHWLDVARYNDGFGMGYDGGDKPQAFRYRDWVVAALNHDMPYDEFIKQQIAGDLLSGPTAATGFLALGPHYRSDGGDPESIAKARADTLEDRLDTTFRGVMGLTIACARCHDHKFDPIPTRDYYALAGILTSTQVMERRYMLGSQRLMERL